MPTEYPSLLGEGLHALTLTELHRIAVGCGLFNLSKTREPLMKSLWTLVACLNRWGVGEELWVDGSFLTEKIDPNDIDTVLIMSEDFENTASEEQLGVWDWWDSNEPKALFTCHNFTIARVAVGHPDHGLYIADDRLWKKFFGTSRDGRKKGICRILLPDGCV